MIALIPSLEPDSRLPRLVAELRAAGLECLVVDDGSGPAYAGMFGAAHTAGAHVLSYPDNRGKGYALRRGFAWCLKNRPGEAVVCADSDGQHAAADILAVVAEAREHPEALVLGARTTYGAAARAAGVPWKSRLGGRTSALFFRLASGKAVADTQTGLRAYGPGRLVWMLGIPGDRFEYELNALLAAADAGVPIREVPIATVYENANAGTHFRPIADSARVMRPLLAFLGVGLSSWAFEMGAFLLLTRWMGIVPALVAARVASSILNFALNKVAVFGERSRARTRVQALQYAALAVALLGTTAVGVRLLAGAGLPSWLAKTVLDVVCSAASFAIQRRWIFRHEPAADSGAPAGAGQGASVRHGARSVTVAA